MSTRFLTPVLLAFAFALNLCGGAVAAADSAFPNAVLGKWSGMMADARGTRVRATLSVTSLSKRGGADILWFAPFSCRNTLDPADASTTAVGLAVARSGGGKCDGLFDGTARVTPEGEGIRVVFTNKAGQKLYTGLLERNAD